VGRTVLERMVEGEYMLLPPVEEGGGRGIGPTGRRAAEESGKIGRSHSSERGGKRVCGKPEIE